MSRATRRLGGQGAGMDLLAETLQRLNAVKNALVTMVTPAARATIVVVGSAAVVNLPRGG